MYHFFFFQATTELSKGTNKAKVVVSQKLADVTSKPKMSVEDYVIASQFFNSFSKSLDFSSKPKKETVESIVTVSKITMVSDVC